MNQPTSPLKKLYALYFTVPDRIPEPLVRNFRIWLIAYPIGILMHLTQLFFFYSIGEKELTMINLVSLIIWVGGIYIHRIGYTNTAAFLLALEIILHAAACVYYIGWDFGFQYYILIAGLTIFLHPPPLAHKVLKAMTLLLSVIFFIMLWYYASAYPPKSLHDTSLTILVNSINITVLFFLLAFIIVFFGSLVEKAEFALRLEHQKSESLLHNILPITIAKKLKLNSGVIADYFENTTILFADIVGFTALSEKISPNELINILNRVFSAFDDLIEKYGLEKIKTIGDAYMVASGIPNARADHADAAAQLALDMLAVLKAMNDENGDSFSIRIGMNSGPAVAGVIGKKKFIYDLWGDSVNTASRMESHGISGEIQVSQTTYELLKDQYRFEPRGIVKIKGKGDMNAYLLKGKMA